MKIPVDINEIARNAIHLAKLDGEPEIALRTSFFDPLPLVAGSPDQLARAIRNLLVNARKSLDGVDAGAIEIETEPDGDLVAIRLLDNGPGMPAGLLEQIFDPFASREESADAPDSKESEVALEIFESWKILHEHSGTLTVRSRPGEGTCFVALLPVHRS